MGAKDMLLAALCRGRLGAAREFLEDSALGSTLNLAALVAQGPQVPF
jgi:hypothetical protein